MKQLFIPFLILCSCTSEHQMNDLDRLNLSGNVTSMKTESYDLDGVTKRDPFMSPTFDTCNNGYYVFNDKGNIQEYKWSQYSSSASNSTTYSYEYDKDGKLDYVCITQEPSNPYQPTGLIAIKYDNSGRPLNCVTISDGEMLYEYEGNSTYPSVRKSEPSSPSVQFIVTNRHEIDSLGRTLVDRRTSTRAYGSTQYAVYSYNDKGDVADIKFNSTPDVSTSFRSALGFEYTKFDDKGNWIERKVTSLNFGGTSDSFIQKRIITYK